MIFFTFFIVLFCATINAELGLNSSLESSIQPRIYRGSRANRKDFPYVARLIAFEHYYSDKQFDCGGALISDYHVLTAAHCIHDCKNKICLNFVVVILGDTDRKKKEDKHRIVQHVERKNIIIHKGYRVKNKHFDNDIAIIPLPERVIFTDYIKPANLPSPNQGSLLDKTVYVAGWGENGNKPSTILLSTTMKIVAYEKCHIYDSFVPTMQLCAQGKRTGTCEGDSGGPYVIREETGTIFKKVTGWTVVGISSFGSPDCTKSEPDALTNVRYYLDWIQINTNILSST